MRRWIITLLVVVLVLAAAQYGLQRVGEAQLQRFERASQGWANIKVERARFWLWGVVDLKGVRVQPSTWLTGLYGLPLGYTLRIGELRIHHFVPGWNGGLVLDSVAIDARRVHLPIPRWTWLVTVARDRDGERMWAPSLTDLGVYAFNVNIAGSAHFRDGFNRPRVQLAAHKPGLADAALECELQLPPDLLDDPAALAIKACQFDYLDRGLVTHFEQVMARHGGVSVARLQTAIAEQIALASARAHWPYDSRQAMQSFVHAPRQPLQIDIHPPQPLSLEKIPRGVWPGLPAFIGLRASLPGAMPDFVNPRRLAPDAD